MKKQLTNIEVIQKVLSILKTSIGSKRYYLIFYFGFFASIISALEPFLFIKIIGYIENFYKTGTFELSQLLEYIGYWGFFVIFYLLVTYINRYYVVDRACLQFYQYMFTRYSKKILHIDYGTYLGLKSGEVYSKFNKGNHDSFWLLFFLFLDILRSFSGVLIIIIVLFFVNPLMTGASILMLPVMIYMGTYFNKNTTLSQRKINDIDDANYGMLSDAITNTYLVKNLSLEDNFYNTIKNKLLDTLVLQFKVSKRWSVSDVYTGVLVMISRILVIILGTYLISRGELSLALLFLYFTFVGWIYFPLSMIFSKLRNIQEQFITVGKYFEEFDNLNTEDISKNKTGNNKTKISGNIEFKDVNFGYTQNKTILQDLSFSIKKGEKIAFVGNTGAGKSTIINLIFRLWEIEQGEITIDNINIQDISKKDLRNSIGLVAQDNSLFNLSIKENLLFAKENATDAELDSAITSANANFVFELENGIETVIGERGLKLSGGEKQRISIARLFLKNPEIIILDEATSALDNKTEKLIQRSLDTLLDGKTSIIIAHRLSTIQNVDKIFMLENGKIIESGNYTELVQLGGKFSELVNPEHLIVN